MAVPSGRESALYLAVTRVQVRLNGVIEVVPVRLKEFGIQVSRVSNKFRDGEPDAGVFVAVSIYTDDKEALLDAVSRSDDRVTATELVAATASRDRALHQHRMQELVPAVREQEREREELIYER